VCQRRFQIDDEVVSLKQGSMRFHKKCYEEWEAGKVKLLPFVQRGKPGK
jgi:hypothetical protein